MFELHGELPKKAALYVNSKARRGEAFESARKIIRDLGIELVDSQPLSDRSKFQTAVLTQIRKGTPLIIVGGGDGTLSSVARFFAEKETLMGVLPVGTGNSFARDLGIPEDLEGACRVLVGGKPTNVDLGFIGNVNFLNVATVGLTSQIAEGLNPEAKRVLGRAAYLFAVMRALATIEPFVVKLEVPDGLQTFECLQLVIGNGRFHAGPFPVSKDASITGPFLAIYALATRNKAAFFKMALHMSNGSHVDLAEVRYFRARSGRLNTVPSRELVIDGEPCLRTPESFGMLERALAVVAPQRFNG